MPERTEKRGIVVIGFPRSGTTLLRRILNAHSNIACPGETYVLSGCARFVAAERILDGLEVGPINGLALAGTEPQETLRLLREFAISLLERHAAKASKPRWAEKTAIDAFHLDEIERILEESVQYVLVYRHALDVCVSVQQWCATIERYPDEVHRYVRRNPKPLEAFAEAWVDVVTSQLSFAARHADSVVAMKYEDLVESPESESKRLLEALGEPWEDSIVEKALQPMTEPGFGDWKSVSKQRVVRGSVGRWSQLSPTTISELGAIVNDTLQSCGYEPVDVVKMPDRDAARRRYELRLQVQALRKDAPDP